MATADVNEGIIGSKKPARSNFGSSLSDQAGVDVVILTTVQRLHITDKHFVNRLLSLTESLR